MITDFSMRSYAGPLKSPCVAHADTDLIHGSGFRVQEGGDGHFDLGLIFQDVDPIRMTLSSEYDI